MNLPDKHDNDYYICRDFQEGSGKTRGIPWKSHCTKWTIAEYNTVWAAVKVETKQTYSADLRSIITFTT